MKADAPVNLSNVASGCKIIPSRHLTSQRLQDVCGQASVTVATAWVGWDSADRESSGVMRQFGIGNVILSSSTIRTEYSLIAH